MDRVHLSWYTSGMSSNNKVNVTLPSFVSTSQVALKCGVMKREDGILCLSDALWSQMIKWSTM